LKGINLKYEIQIKELKEKLENYRPDTNERSSMYSTKVLSAKQKHIKLSLPSTRN